MTRASPASRPGRSHNWLHTRLSGVFFLYYVAVGAWVPFWPLYLQHLGYTPAQIGIALGATGGVRIFLPVIWGWVMDRSGHRMPWIVGSMLVSSIFFAMVPWTSSFAWLVALHVAYAIFWNAALPAFDVVTLNHIAQTGAHYTRIRLWGSIGFIVAVAALGPILDRTGVGPVPWVVVGAMLAMVAFGATIPDVHDRRAHLAPPTSFLASLRRPGILALLGAAFLSQLSFAPFYGFFSIYLEQHDYDRGTIGMLWALGVIAEVIVFLYTGCIIQRHGARAVLMISVTATAVRWVMLALFVDVPVLLVTSQVMHFLSFALFHAVTVHYIHELFPGRLQGRGQALLAGTSYG
ncbi:MAG TPA: MFS transporter, partial [Nevskiaceae bacterium]|nr:MFS transporter [Nevskiaceae bacterium]